MLKAEKLMALMQDGHLCYVMPMDGVDHTNFIDGIPVSAKALPNDKTKLLDNNLLNDSIRMPDVTPNVGSESPSKR